MTRRRKNENLNSAIKQLVQHFDNIIYLYDNYDELAPSFFADELVNDKVPLVNKFTLTHLCNEFKDALQNLTSISNTKVKNVIEDEEEEGKKRSMKPFYMSDQYINYIKHCNLGNGLAFAMVFYEGLSLEEKRNFARLNGNDKNDIKVIEEFVESNLDKVVAACNKFEEVYVKEENRITFTENNIFDYINPLDGISIIVDDNIMPGTSLMVLTSLISIISSTKSKDQPQYIHMSKEMEKYLNDKKNKTRWLLKKEDVTKRPISSEQFKDEEEYEDFVSKLGKTELTLLERLEERENQRREEKKGGVPSYIPKGQEEPGTDAYGYKYSFFAVINSIFRIKTELLSTEEKDRLKNESKRIDEAAAYILRLKTAQKML
jgi:hypothetical protein